jgi:hypothetical protein
MSEWQMGVGDFDVNVLGSESTTLNLVTNHLSRSNAEASRAAAKEYQITSE